MRLGDVLRLLEGSRVETHGHGLNKTVVVVRRRPTELALAAFGVIAAFVVIVAAVERSELSRQSQNERRALKDRTSTTSTAVTPLNPREFAKAQDALFLNEAALPDSWEVIDAFAGAAAPLMPLHGEDERRRALGGLVGWMMWMQKGNRGAIHAHDYATLLRLASASNRRSYDVYSQSHKLMIIQRYARGMLDVDRERQTFWARSGYASSEADWFRFLDEVNRCYRAGP